MLTPVCKLTNLLSPLAFGLWLHSPFGFFPGSRPSSQRIRSAAARLALASTASSSAACFRSDLVQQVSSKARQVSWTGVGPAEQLIGFGGDLPAGEQGLDILDGQHLLEHTNRHQAGQMLFGVLLLVGMGDQPVFHIVVDHGAGQQAGLLLPLEQLQALPQVQDHLVHIERDGRQFLPSGRGGCFPFFCPGRYGAGSAFHIHDTLPFPRYACLVLKVRWDNLCFPVYREFTRLSNGAVAFPAKIRYNSREERSAPPGRVNCPNGPRNHKGEGARGNLESRNEKRIFP